MPFLILKPRSYPCQTLESLNFEPGIHCISHIEKMDHKATQDKLRKNSIDFKRRRAQLHKQKLNLESRKQSKEGNTYQSGIGLNLDPNNSSKLIEEFDIINLKISSEELKNFEKYIPELTVRSVAEKFSYDRNNVYNFVMYDIETNTSGKKAEICQLSAVDRSGLHCFNDYILPLRDVDIHATRVNGLSVRGVSGVRTLLKDNQPVETVSLSKSLENFLTFLEKTVRHVKSDKNIYTVLTGHNSQVFDTPTLLRQGGHQFCEKLSRLNVFFADTLPVMKNLVKRKHPLLLSPDGSKVKLNQQSIYQTLFHEPFAAHDSLEDVKALRRIVFDSRLNISEDMLTENMSTTQYAENDMKYLDRRHELLQTFRGTLFHPTNAEFPIKRQIAEKIAGTGMSYHTKAEEGHQTSDFRLRTSDFGLPTSDFRLPTSDFRLPTSDFRLQTSDFRLPTSDFRLPTSDFRLQTSDFRLQTSDFGLRTSDFRLQTSDFRLGLISADLRVVVVINMKHVEKYNRVISEQSVAKPNEAERLSKNKKRKKRRKNAMQKRMITEREKKYIN